MGYDQEYDNVMMKVGQGATATAYLMTASTRGTIKLIQFIARLIKKNMLKEGQITDFNKFVKLTDGKFDIVNVPAQSDVKFDALTKNLKNFGVHFCVMPDLNAGDGVRQVAVMRDDAQKFNAFYERYILNTLDGGKKDFQELNNFTNGKISLVSIPYNEQQLRTLREDLDKLNINYAIMPDLNVGDGKVQLSVASSDLPKLQHWFDLYRGDMMNKGVNVGDMEQMTVTQYADMGNITPEQYMDTATPEMKEAVAGFGGQEKGTCEKTIDKMENQIKSVSDEKYHTLKNDPKYIEITINKETCLDSSISSKAKKLNENPEFSDYFSSRVPGTYGDGVKILTIPKSQVFSTDGGNTFIGFIPKDKKPMVFDGSGKLIYGSERQTGKELFIGHYDSVNRDFQNKSKNILTPEKGAKVAGKAIKAPTPPLQVK